MLVHALLHAALAATPHDLGTWTSVNAQANLHPERDAGPRLWLDVHGRRTDASFTALVRPAVGWDLTDGVGAFVGYAWVPSIGEATDDELVHESRVWEQLLLGRKVHGVSLGLRPRLEQRLLHGQDGTGHRLRLWGRAGAPVHGPLSLAVTDEVFLGLNETAWSPSGFDQNRLFVGPALPVAEVGRVEVGYMNTFLNRASGDTMLHVVSANLYLNL